MAKEPKDADNVAVAHASILLVDDDPIILDSLGGFLKAEGYSVTCVAGVAAAMEHLTASRFNLVMADVSMPTSAGFELLRFIRERDEETVVVFITGYGTIESAVEAIKQGAYDYLTKPIIDDDVRLAVQRALQQQRLLEENRQLKAALEGRYSFSNIIGSDPRMAKVFDVIAAVAEASTTVLITGESGTGKSLIARAIHQQSPRANGPFVEVSCGALPDTLLESELFGHVKGAFTHAVSDREGKFAAADGGTIFLDEISSASPQLQAKLLRVLQERKFEPLGSNVTRKVDVRVVLATNRDLLAAAREGLFRQDLYYRVNVVNIELPPLRDRVADIPLLAEHFLSKFLAGTKKGIHGFSSQAMQLMQSYPWPGNVRELENCVERAAVLCRESWIAPHDLAPAVLEHSQVQAAPSTAANMPAGAASTDAQPGTLEQALSSAEKAIIAAALRRHAGSRTLAAKELRIHRATLFKKMKEHGLFEEAAPPSL